MPTSTNALLFLLSVVSLLAMPSAHAEDAQVDLVADLMEVADEAAGLTPFSLAVADGKLFFAGRHPLTGSEPWTSDGTPAGTRLVADTCPGPCGSLFSLVPLAGAVYFESCDAAEVCQLWRSDGTAEGTAAVTRFSRRNARVGGLTAWNGGLYFVAADAVHGAELFRSDGTPGGTELAVDLVPGPGDAGIHNLTAVGDRLFFSANDGIWASDGTPAGTTRVRSQIGNQVSSSPIVAAGNRAFFVESHFDLWTSDGTAAGTRRVLASNRVLTLLATRGGDVYFTRLDEPYEANELWTSNGTAAGTRRVRGGFPYLGRPSNGVEHLGELYFSAGEEVWKTDGTAPGTVPVASIGERIQALGVGAPGELLVGTADSLWRIDGDGELELVSDAVSARGFTAFEDGAAFQANSAAEGSELAVVAGGAVTVLSEIVDPGSSRPVELTARGNSLVFADSLVPAAVWETDGTAAGTRRLMELHPSNGIPGDGVRNVAAGGHTFVLDHDLWVVRAGGLVRLFEELPPGAAGWRWLLHDTAVAFRNRLFFLVWSFETDHIELWSSDGTPGGTRKLDELQEYSYCFICDPPAPVPTFGAVAAGGRLFAFFEDRLWVSDGRPGAVEVDLGVGCGSCTLGSAAAVGDRLFFTTAGYPYNVAPPDPRRLWTSDGSTAGTFVVREFGPPRPGAIPAAIDELLGVGATLYFTVETPGLGDELWSSDGTAAGTVPVVDLRPGRESSNPRGFAVLRGELYFAADDGVHGRELWASDGTAAGTRLVADLRPGAASSSPAELAAIDGRLYFAAADGVAGLEPWTSDGSAAGTVRLADLQPGPLPSSPSSFRAAGGSVFFSAGTEDGGFELWSTPRERCESCLLDGRFLVTAEWIRNGVRTSAEQVEFSDETALFWFFDRSNTELVVKLLDGRPLNGHFWVFYGALSDLEYEIRVEDLFTGAVRTYHNAPDNLCGGSDILAFRGEPGAPATLPAVRGTAAARDKGAGPCPGDPRDLCLRDGRFAVRVEWTNQHAGGVSGLGRAIPDTDETGYFWFFDQDNLELAVKLLDGSRLNGKLWFFYGALSDVEYVITVTDRQTGAVRTYHNPPGDFCGGADIEALDP
jgi:ELWxxDGT repeat protein